MTDEPLKIFISWSGELAKAVGTVLHEWLPTMFDQVQPWMSDVDIEAGSRGLNEIEQALLGTRFGIIIATHGNQHAPWLNFESGALSKAIGNNPAFVAPLLVDFQRETDLTGPLQQFQSNLMTENGLRRIMGSIAALLTVEKRAWEPRFKALWPDLEQRLAAAAVVSGTSLSVQRSQDDLLAEILAHVRSLVRTADSPALPRRAPSVIDDFTNFINSIDWDVRSHSAGEHGGKLFMPRVGLAKPVDDAVIEAAKTAIQDRFGVEAVIEVDPTRPDDLDASARAAKRTSRTSGSAAKRQPNRIS